MSVAEQNGAVVPALGCMGLTVQFGGLLAVKNIDMSIAAGNIHSLIGPNGAGKTTLVNCLTGFIPATTGQIRFGNHDICGLAPNRIASLGIARTFQNIRLFPGMTVLENVLVGAHRRFRSSFFCLVFRRKIAERDERENLSRARAMLDFVGLHVPEDQFPTALPYGHQRRLEIARALVSEPLVLMLDEPMAGMNPHEKSDLARLIHRIRDRQITVLLIEHDVEAVRALSDRVSVLHHGEMIADDVPSKVFADPAVERAYLARSVT